VVSGELKSAKNQISTKKDLLSKHHQILKTMPIFALINQK